MGNAGADGADMRDLSVSHLLASARAGDEILAVRVPPAADKLRRLMNLAQMVQSHALSFFHLSAPDFLMGWDAPVETRNVFGLLGKQPELVRAGGSIAAVWPRSHRDPGRQEGASVVGGSRGREEWFDPGRARTDSVGLAGGVSDRAAGSPSVQGSVRQSEPGDPDLWQFSIAVPGIGRT